MPRKGAKALGGVAAFCLAAGLVQIGNYRYTHVGTQQAQESVAATVPFVDVDLAQQARVALIAKQEQDAEATRQAEATLLEMRRRVEEQRQAEQAAAERAQRAVEAAAAARVTPTTVRAPVATTAPVATVSTGSGACGGSLPPCYVMMRESGGDIHAVNPSSGAAGKWQFLPSSSRALGYPLPMNNYDEATQDAAARTLWQGGAGCQHWSAC